MADSVASRRWLGAAFVVLGATAVAAQFPGGPTRSPSALRAVPAETTAAEVKDPSWKAPRTAWGHPDLQGIWTSDDMRGMPTTRPAGQAGRESLTPEEFARARGAATKPRATARSTRRRSCATSSACGPSATRRSSSTRRMAACRRSRRSGVAMREARAGVGTFGTGPFDDFDDFSLYDRCITRGVERRHAGAVRQRPPDRADADRRGRSATRWCTTRASSRSTAGRTSARPSSSTWAMPAAAGKATRWSSRRRTSPTSVGTFGGPNSEKLKLTERFTRIDPQMIDYRVRVDDPVTYTAPFTLRFTITQQPAISSTSTRATKATAPWATRSAASAHTDRKVAEARAKGLPDPAAQHGDGGVFGRARPRAASRYACSAANSETNR